MDLQQSETDDKQPEQLVIYVCGGKAQKISFNSDFLVYEP